MSWPPESDSAATPPRPVGPGAAYGVEAYPAQRNEVMDNGAGSGDLAGTTVGLVLVAIADTIGTAIAAALGLGWPGDGGDSSGPALAATLTLVAPWVLLAAAVAGSIVLRLRQRPAFWVPIVAGLVSLLAWGIGIALLTGG